MTIFATKDLLYFVLSVAVVWIAFFICWALYEVARLVRQTNEIVTETRAKIRLVEDVVESLRDKIGASTRLIASLVSGGKTIAGMFGEKKKGRRKNSEDEE